jgi:hypothetical protein
MSHLPESFETKYFDLLQPITTSGTLRNRRNLLVASFSIVVLYFLDRSLTELKVLGIDLSNTNTTSILWSGLVLVAFWFVMYCVHASKDSQINKERRHLLLKHSEQLSEQIEASREQCKSLDSNHPKHQRVKEMEGAYKIYLDQKERILLTCCLWAHS